MSTAETIKALLGLIYLVVILPWSIYLMVKVAQHVEAWPFG